VHTWSLLHLFVDEDGISHVNPQYSIELTDIEFAPPAPPMIVSDTSGTQAIVMVELPVSWQGGWHPSPCEQWVICLAGEMGYQAEDGTEFMLRPGSCILTTDTRGKGHNSWNAGSTPVRLALVQR
jgi:quercetin dioxygenase-like cupin family protein